MTGIDFRKDKIEYIGASSRNMRALSAAGILFNKDMGTKIEGLFAAGDEVGGLPFSSAPGALTMGWHAGHGAARHAKKENQFLKVKGAPEEVLKDSCSRMLNIKEGDHWKEVELAVQNTLDFYRGDVTSGRLLERGIDRLNEIRGSVSLKARNPHELWRCLEVMSIMDNAEMVMRASLERRESRKDPVPFSRIDFLEQDDENYFAFLSIKREDGKFKCSKIPLQRQGS